MDEIWGSRLQVPSLEVGLACTTRTNGRGKLQIKMEVNELRQKKKKNSSVRGNSKKQYKV